MLTVLRVKLALLPLAAFILLAARGEVFWAAAAGLGLGVAALAWRRRDGVWMQAEIAALIAFAAAFVFGGLLGIGGGGQWIATLELALAAMSALSLWRGVPWTADYARADYRAEAASPVFHHVNVALTALWGVLFAAMAVALLLRASGWVVSALVAFGLVVSAFGPALAIRCLVRRLLKTERFDWPAPALAPASPTIDIAIVGAGIGGLTAGALLANAGARVIVCEAHDVAGGYSHSFIRKARHDGAVRRFRFDAGVHDVSGVRPGGPVTTLLEKVGAPALDWRRLDHRYVHDGHVFDVPRDPEAYVASLGAMFPDSAAGIAAVIADIRAVFEAMYSEAPNASGVPGRPRTLDGLLAFPKRYPLAMQWLDKPFLDFVRRHVTDAAAIRMLMGLAGYVGDNPATITVGAMVPLFGYVFFGGYYPRGGSGRIADALVDVIARAGGAVRTRCEVARIDVEAGAAKGLTLSTGESIRASAVVANSDLKRTFLELIGREHLAPTFVAEVASLQPACSAVAVHLAVKREITAPPIIHVATGGTKLGIVLPSRVDPDAAPDGYTTMELLQLVPHREAKTWFSADEVLARQRRAPAYLARKAAIGDRLLAVAETVFPGLAADIVMRADASPLTYARYDRASDGSIYGMDGMPRPGSKSPLRNLVLAGAATHGAGIEAVMISGARAAEALVPGILDGAAR